MEHLVELIKEFNWSVVLIVIISSGFLSYMGDRLGMHLAKKRISLYGIRPKSTSTIITVLMGVLISLTVLVVLTFVSGNVRSALFSIKYINREMSRVNLELVESRDKAEEARLRMLEAETALLDKETEIEGLQSRSEKLSADLEILVSDRDKLLEETAQLSVEANRLRYDLNRFQAGKIIVFVGEMLGQEVVLAGSSEEAVRRHIAVLNDRVRFEVASRGGVDPTSVILSVQSEDIESVVQRCMLLDSRKFIRASAPYNLLQGEEVTISYRVYESALVFSEGEVVYSEHVNYRPTSYDAEGLLRVMLREANRRFTNSGVIGDPLTGMVGQISAPAFFEAVETLSTMEPPFTVKLLAEEDVYSEGPVRVEVVIEQGPES